MQRIIRRTFVISSFHARKKPPPQSGIDSIVWTGNDIDSIVWTGNDIRISILSVQACVQEQLAKAKKLFNITAPLSPEL